MYGTKHVPKLIRLKKAERVLQLTFDDGTFNIPHELLRVYSPSAEVRGHDGKWDIPPHRRNVSVFKVEPVGNYAVRLLFDDLHDTGIFPYDLLHDMGTRKFHYMRRYLRELKAQNKTRKERKSVARKKT